MLLKKIKSIEQSYNTNFSRCSFFKEITKIYFLKFCIYTFEDNFKEDLNKEDAKIIGFGN